MRLVEIMKVHAVIATPESTISEIVDLMDLYQISHLPIVDNLLSPLGIVTIDRIYQTLQSGSGIRDLGDLMTNQHFSLDENRSTDEAEQMLAENPLRRLCVTSKGRLVGTVGWVELCQFRLRQ